MRSGAGRDTSGALHHSYVSGLEVEGEDLWSKAFDAENAIPENAYLSQMIMVPESSRDLIRELRTPAQSGWRAMSRLYAVGATCWQSR